ncbi:SH3 domain-containing protein [Aggregatilinea lenta]|uniref:SH3 domain-containing protein n=1 Tax=Aggregatilinea lenta TaxID=913108 RepID=UPI000E5BD13A|nr:SH3 domain-containing protein [Aggregatilinea lenta]
MSATKRSPKIIALIAAALTVALAATPLAAPVRAQGGSGADPAPACRVRSGASNVNVRYGPNAGEYGVIGVLYAGQQLPVTGQNASGDWYAVTFDAAGSLAGPREGWIAANVVETEGGCDGVPVLADPGQPEEIDLLLSIPVLPTLDAESLRAIFAHGQSLGNDPRVFTKVGDCNTDTSYFLSGFDQDNYDLGPYADLAPSVDYYAGSWEHISLAGQVGFNALSMLDPMWADQNQCRFSENEGPLACEYRIAQPSVALMMFGPNDLINLTEEQYADALRGVIDLSLDRGVIPVLSTFTWHHDRMWFKSLRLNAITVEIAQEYGLPLVNFWRAAQDLPNLGLVEGYTHLTSANTGTRMFEIRFTGEEATAGYALRNLVTLQVLDLLRTEVLEAE